MFYKSFISQFILCVVFLSLTVYTQVETGIIGGSVVDESGSVVIGATVSVINQNNSNKKTTITDKNGKYTFTSLELGKYIITVYQDGFATFESSEIKIESQKVITLNVQLKVEEIKEEVSVGDSSELSSDSGRNLDALILDEKEIGSLPDDEESLSEVLRALAGPSAGPNGAQIIVDGFSSGELPPKDTIREIRINSNPFSSEFASLGHGRIQIFTRPGSGRFHAETFFAFADESLNSRSPFVERKVPSQNRELWGYVGNSLIKDKLSYSLSFGRYENDENKVVKATSLDSNFNKISVNETLAAPRKRDRFSTRLDYQINKNHTLVGRYNYGKLKTENLGVGDFSLTSRAFDSTSSNHTIRLIETAIINESLVNEMRFQFINSKQSRNDIDNSPSINVFGAFNGGGTPVGEALNRRNNWEFTNISTWSWGNHALRAGGTLRVVYLDNISPQNFNGTYSFAGGIAPQLNANNEIVVDGSGQPILIPITSLERYRRTLLFQQLGFTPENIRTFGGGATQFSIASGNPQAKINQVDFGGFFQDDWRIKPNFTLGFGLRYEAQTNISDNLNLAPRISFAWAPKFGNKESSKMVIRGGAGIFFNRFGENLTLQAERFNGINQKQFIVSDPTVLDIFPNIPSTNTLDAIPQTVWRIADNIRSPYTIQSSVSLERQLPLKINFVATFINTRIINMLRARNINAPLNGIAGGVQPFGEGNIYQYESSGVFKQKQLIFNLSKRSKMYFLSANYSFSKAESDTDGANSYPANQYDLSNEFGRSSLDIRHRFTFRGFVNAPWNSYLSTFVIASSGAPFNITTGQDSNGDSFFNERPAFATDLSRVSVVRTDFGDFDTDPLPNQQIIPRNYGSSPSFFSVNMGLYKTIGFGPKIKNMKGKHTHRGDTKRGYNLTFGIRANNIFNNVNFAPPIGNLRSPLFGQSTSTLSTFGHSRQQGTATNRSVSLSLRLSY